MILQALHHLAQREELVADLDYEPKPVGYLVRVDDGGRFLGFQSTYSAPEAEEGARKKPVPRPKIFRVPRETTRTSGDRAFLFVDKSEYAFGLDPDGTRPADKLARRFDLFRERVAHCAETTRDSAAQAVRDFLESLATGAQAIRLPEEVKPNDLFAFVYRGEEGLVTDRPAVKRYVKTLRQAEAGDPIQCLVTGELAPPAVLHTQVKYVPGASSSGVPLVSFNAPAFESYGWSSNDNAPVSRDAAETYATALQRLLHPQPPAPWDPSESLPRRNVRLSEDTVVCFWAAETSGEEVAALTVSVLEASEEEQVGNLFRSIWSGRTPEIEDPSAFYALTLSGAQGRVAVRSWLETTVADAARNLSFWVRDLEIARLTPPPKGKEAPPPYALRDRLRALAPPGKGDVPAPLAAKAADCALRGDPLPLSFLTRSVQRYRAELGKTDYGDRLRRDAQAAWIRAVLARRNRLNPQPDKEIAPVMDPNNHRPGYLLGRLMAVLERLQQEAMGDVNASVIDRFFSAASATPRSVFTRLLKGARHHARKARDSNKRVLWLEKLMDDIADRFKPDQGGFPAHLSLEEQGLFVLGYHQQRHDLFQSKKNREAAAEQAASA